MNSDLSDDAYASLAAFRYSLRAFSAFSEQKAAEAGLTPQQHQALLTLRAAPDGAATVGYVAERLILRPHSASGLVDRLVTLGFVERRHPIEDRRRALLALSTKGRAVLRRLSATHREEIRRVRPTLVALLAAIDTA